MDQLPVEIQIDGYWNPQLHDLLILTAPHQSCFLLYKCRIGEVIFTTEMFPWWNYPQKAGEWREKYKCYLLT